MSQHTGECPYGCPVCAGIGLLKHVSPDVADHLAAAAREFVLAARAFMETMAEQSSKVTEPPLEKVWFEDEA